MKKRTSSISTTKFDKKLIWEIFFIKRTLNYNARDLNRFLKLDDAHKIILSLPKKG